MRAPMLRIIWFIALFVGWVLSTIKAILKRPTFAAKYEPDALEAQARTLARIQDPFEDNFHRVALRTVVINSFLHSEMSAFVAIVPFHQMLEKKLRIERALKYCSSPRPPAVFIVGLPRTGSTLLHQLCSMDPRARAIRAWEFRMPFEASDAPKSRAARIEKVQKMLDGFYKLAPAIKKIHYVRALDADECVQGFFDCILPDWFLWGAVDAPEAFNWYVNGDMTPQYENYKKFLRVVLEQPDDNGQSDPTPKHLWLKTPHHTFKLPELARVFPEAKFIWLHRDPAKAVGSCCSMNEAILDATCPRFINPEALGERTLTRLAHCVRKGMKDRESLEAQGRIFVDVHYSELKRDLTGTMRRMYEGLGLDPAFPPSFVAALEKHASSKDPQEVAHKYTLDHFGLDSQRIHREFSQYMSKYM